MGHTALYAGVGAELSRYEFELDAFSLSRRESVRLPSLVQDTVQHASRPFVYVASSNWVSPHEPGTHHYLSALRIDPQTGALQPHGQPLRIANHPVHLTTDADSKHLLVACNV